MKKTYLVPLIISISLISSQVMAMGQPVTDTENYQKLKEIENLQKEQNKILGDILKELKIQNKKQSEENQKIESIRS